MKINQRKIGTILSYVQIFSSNTVSLFYTPYMLRMLGQSEYGLFGTASSLTSYLSLLSFGIAGAYVRYNTIYRANGDEEGENRLNGMFVSMFSVLAFLVLIVGTIMVFISDSIFGASLTDEELKKIKVLISLTTCQYAITFIFNTVAMAILAYERYFFVKMCLIIAGIAQPIINVIVLAFGGKAISISVMSLIISVVTYVTYLVYAKKYINFKMSFKGFEKTIFKSIFIFSGYLFLNSITDQITNSTDSLLLGAFCGTVAVSVYTIGATFGRFFTAFSTSVSSVFSTQINRIVAAGIDVDEKLNNIFLKVGRVQFLILALILSGYIIFGLDFINIWAGEDYGWTSYLVGLFLLLSTFVPLFQNVGLEIQKAKNLHKARSIVYLLIALSNAILTAVVIICLRSVLIDQAQFDKFASIGAAATTFFSCFWGYVVFMNIYYHKKVGLNIVRFWKNIFRISFGIIIPIILGVLLKVVLPITSLSIFLVEAIIYCVLYFIFVWIISMNDYERSLITSPLKRIKTLFTGKNKS